MPQKQTSSVITETRFQMCGYTFVRTAHACFVTVIFNLLFTVTYRRDRSIREAYEERFMTDRPVSVHTKTSQHTSALHHPLFCFYSLITLILSIMVGSISKDSWRSGEERPLWQTRGWLQPWWVRIWWRATLFSKWRGPTKLPRRSAGLPWWKCAFPCWTQNWSTLKKSENIHFIVNLFFVLLW